MAIATKRIWLYLEVFACEVTNKSMQLYFRVFAYEIGMLLILYTNLWNWVD